MFGQICRWIADGDRSRGTESNVWDVIPPWQYGGRHVEGGGLTRADQAFEAVETVKSKFRRCSLEYSLDVGFA